MPTYHSPGVYVEEVSSGSRPIEGVGTAVCAFVGFTERGVSNQPTLVTNWTQYTKAFGGFVDGAHLPQSVYGYFLNGGGAAYVVRVGAPEPLDASAAGGGTHDRADGGTDALGSAAGGELPAAGGGGRPALRARALEPGAAGNELSVEVTEAGEPGEELFRLVVRQGDREVEAFDNLSLRRGPRYAATVVKESSQLIALDEIKGAQTLVPAKGARVVLSGGASSSTVVAPAPAPAPITPADYVGDTADRTGFAGLEAIENVTMLCVPDLMAAYQRGAVDLDGVKAVQLAMIAHCELMADRVAILDAPPGLGAQQVRDWRMDVAGYDSKYAALYWPWIKVMDPVQGRPALVPPSGYIAGVWARSDETRGVHKAPANEVVRGVIDLETTLTRGEHDQLNPVAVNCIRAFPGQGIRVWGARTLSSDPEWRYLNVRRLFNFVEKSILDGTNWVVFEPNDRFLWGAVRRTITMFLRRVWRSGALFGRTPEEAFFVKCDEENNPPEDRDAGILTVDIGIAPVKPAEFIVFRVSQYSQGAALDE
ncbi:phage tail sheath family protein [Streptacidiphilus sp. PB12-B1b]|uniref:phage tail sheath family protein n=1 Tax=Streptacidiphilus sp. PB12-B1b TaxID=2705012 RepID=UPI0015F9D82B|nr:phage tail sheath subtilisin-like domain-containing protein [Streptacidiphilus sp. PB12-B1b]QMU78001.1 phage tail sheath family protein [Streptacidiphilus sp. PB12-B1b]